MAGYNGFKMSNNAVAAYQSGEKPLSKWTKVDIIEAIEDAIREEELTLNGKQDTAFIAASCFFCINNEKNIDKVFREYYNII